MVPTPRVVLAVTLAAIVALGALVAGADHPGQGSPASRYRLPINEYFHDLYEQRYRPATPEPIRPTTAPPTQRSQPGAGHPQHDGTQPQHSTTAPGQPSAVHAPGTPTAWKFTLPKGDAEKGRAVFAKLECYACHEVKGQPFPGVKHGADIGPELSEMAAHHDAEFFAEAIVNPNAVIDEPRWRGPDGSSRMPSFNDSLTVQELIDLVAFLKSLTPEGADGRKH